MDKRRPSPNRLLPTPNPKTKYDKSQNTMININIITLTSNLVNVDDITKLRHEMDLSAHVCKLVAVCTNEEDKIKQTKTTG
jgi:hypothetical protein